MSVPLGGLEASVESVDSAEASAEAIAGRSPTQIAFHRLRRDKVSMAAFVILVVVVLFALAAPFLRSFGVLDPYSFNSKLVGGFGSMPTGSLGGVTLAHPFGVEPGTGRDVFSRVVLGISFSLLIATAATLLSVVIGLAVGIISGYMGKATDF